VEKTFSHQLWTATHGRMDQSRCRERFVFAGELTRFGVASLRWQSGRLVVAPTLRRGPA
jgi:hypothetical protein